MARPKGSPNKATGAAREAIARFVDGNASKLATWLNQVAQGVPEIIDGEPTGKYIVPANPAKAFELYQSVVEYHIPKLARTEVSGTPDGDPIKHAWTVEMVRPK